MFRTIQDISDLKDKKVLLRVDFDVPLDKSNLKNQISKIGETFRIERQKEMIDYLADRGAKIVMVAHISSTESFADLIPQLHIILGREVGFIKTIEDIDGYLADYQGVGLLDNIRKWGGEEKNDPEFAANLSKGFDLYINNAFAVCHRNHASVSAITQILPSYAGLLIENETKRLSAVIDTLTEGKLIIMGGAKASTKVPAIKNLINKAESIIVGGVLANDILKAKDVDIGDSKVDDNFKELLAGLDLNDSKLILPGDPVIFENKILDIGAKDIEKFKEKISQAKMIVWNGPLGQFEDDRFAIGTNSIAQTIAESNAISIVGGGDTIAAINKIGLLNKFKFVSTGGGAMLEFLAGNQLLGLKALSYYG